MYLCFPSQNPAGDQPGQQPRLKPVRSCFFAGLLTLLAKPNVYILPNQVDNRLPYTLECINQPLVWGEHLRSKNQCLKKSLNR